MEIKQGFESGNWNIESGGNGKGFIQNWEDNREALYNVEGDHISLTAMDGLSPAPLIPKTIQARIIRLEMHNNKVKIKQAAQK